MKHTINKQQYKTLMDLQKCQEWENRLKEYSEQLLFNDEVEIPQEVVRQAKQEADSRQLEVLNTIFKSDGLEVGKWYGVKENNCLHFITRIKGDRYYAYGFNHIGQWKDNTFFGNTDDYDSSFYVATKDEVEKALIKEARKRGFKEGVKFNCNGVRNRRDEVICGRLKFQMDWRNPRKETKNNAGIHCTNNGWIFFDGKWAEIIEETTYKIGQRFKVDRFENNYILAQTEKSKATLINLTTGRRFDKVKEVNDYYNITQKELNSLMSGYSWELID